MTVKKKHMLGEIITGALFASEALPFINVQGNGLAHSLFLGLKACVQASKAAITPPTPPPPPEQPAAAAAVSGST